KSLTIAFREWIDLHVDLEQSGSAFLHCDPLGASKLESDPYPRAALGTAPDTAGPLSNRLGFCGSSPKDFEALAPAAPTRKAGAESSGPMIEMPQESLRCSREDVKHFWRLDNTTRQGQTGPMDVSILVTE
ncbi:MAG: hypothetical protein JO356_19595, partial [Acidobacteria bacterium]|nr:hypothetical protein [Acidobacteriota bacterium]